ncbi:unnamed protein product, partial [Didymodactylos carnosus]
MSNGERDNENHPRPRLCHLRRWGHFAGYGFNLHCEKSKPGQFIGKVDPKSPAEAAGLREHDRIVEVNFVNIGNENHKQVVTRIKEGVSRDGTKYPDEVILLVLDNDADRYYKSKNIVVRGNDPNVEKIETPIKNQEMNINTPSPYYNSNPSESSIVLPTKNNYTKNADFTTTTVTRTQYDSSPSSTKSNNQDNNYKESSSPKIPQKQYNEVFMTTSDQKLNDNTNGRYHNVNNEPKHSVTHREHSDNTVLPELELSVAEFREQLKATNKRDKDPRKQQMSMREKLDMIN